MKVTKLLLSCGSFIKCSRRKEIDPKDYIRVVDESGDDYLYYKKSFELIELPGSTERKLMATLR